MPTFLPMLRSCAGAVAAVVALVIAAPSAHAAADPVKRVRIQVLPYYQAPRIPDDPPLVAVSTRLDKLLASTRREDIERAREDIARDPGVITPMTMMVLAIRLYDVGLRDDAVFWFNVAKQRYELLSRVNDMKTPELAPIASAMGAFIRLAGPVINGYAYCDIDKQREIALTAIDWTSRHPYDALLMPEVPALPGDRKQNYQKALADLLATVKKERDYLAVPANAQRLKALRAQNEADARYCWK